MKYRRLGSSGLLVSPICLGTMTYGTSKWRPWVLDEEESRPFFQRALEMGINFFDTANVYGRGGGKGRTEEVIGNWLAQGNQNADPNRKTLIPLMTFIDKLTLSCAASFSNSASHFESLSYRQFCVDVIL